MNLSDDLDHDRRSASRHRRAVGPHEAAISAMRQAIVNGDFTAGQRLAEVDLCEQFRVSRATIRLALFELAKEGLVTHEPNRGSRVRSLTLPEAIHILEVRMAIESHFAARAAQVAKPHHIDALQRTIGEMAACVSHGDLPNYNRHNTELHEQVLAVSGNEPAEQIVSQLRNQSARQQFKIHMRRGRPDASLAEHAAIVDAITARDPAAAHAAMSTHLQRVMAAYKAALGEQSAVPTDQRPD